MRYGATLFLCAAVVFAHSYLAAFGSEPEDWHQPYRRVIVDPVSIVLSGPDASFSLLVHGERTDVWSI